MSTTVFFLAVAAFLAVELWPRLKHAAIAPPPKFFFLLISSEAAFKKCSSSFPKAAFYRRSFKYSLKLRALEPFFCSGWW